MRFSECPWCGSHPAFTIFSSSPEATVTLGCIEEGCKIKPSTPECNVVEDAIDAWEDRYRTPTGHREPR